MQVYTILGATTLSVMSVCCILCIVCDIAARCSASMRAAEQREQQIGVSATVAVTVVATTAAEEPQPIVIIVTSPLTHPFCTKRGDGGASEDPC